MVISNEISSSHSAHPFTWLTIKPDIPATVFSFIIFYPNRKLSLVRYVGSRGSTFTCDGRCNCLKSLCVSSGVPVDIVSITLIISLQDVVSPIWPKRVL